jgi:hypothetical protein
MRSVLLMQQHGVKGYSYAGAFDATKNAITAALFTCKPTSRRTTERPSSE